MNKRHHSIVARATLDEKIHWQVTCNAVMPDDDDTLFIQFHHYENYKPERAQQELALRLQKNGIRWIWRDGKQWFLDVAQMRLISNGAGDFSWLFGIVKITPTVRPGDEGRGNIITFELTENYMEDITPRRIFLSHKGADKPFVRELHATLKLLGFDPWLDEDAMTAGANLERALLQGMKDSCAAVFFLTDSYKDQNYLATEIDYAVAEKRRKAERFAIIVLVLDPKAMVPDLLKPYVWKTPGGNLEALREVLKALPLSLPPPEWR